VKRITSRQNPLVRLLRQLARAGAADETAIVLDGAHLVGEALSAGLRVRVVAVSDAVAASDEGRRLLDGAREAGTEVVTAAGDILDLMSPTRAPSGVVGVANAAAWALPAALDRRPALVLAVVDVQDPGNAGAIVRAADASGASAVVFCGASADPFGWKALRGSMGSAFRVPLVRRVAVEALIDGCRQRGIRTWAAIPRGGTGLFEADLRGPTCVLLGGEGGGLGPDVATRADGCLTIPMRQGVESLNVAVAAALAGYEAFRQREHARPPAPAGSAAARQASGGRHGRT